MVSVIQIWDDLHNERAGYFRAFWCDDGESTIGNPVIGYCSAGGSHRTIRAAISEVRRLGYRDPVYRNGRLIEARKPRLRIRRCHGNRDAWALVFLKPDGQEHLTFTGQTALSVDSLLERCGNLIMPGEPIELIVSDPA